LIVASAGSGFQTFLSYRFVRSTRLGDEFWRNIGQGVTPPFDGVTPVKLHALLRTGCGYSMISMSNSSFDGRVNNGTRFGRE